MVIANASMQIAPPVRTPLSYGLLSVAQMPTEGDDHWQNGVLYETDPCSRANITTTDCPVPPADKQRTATLALRCSEPFTVYTMPVCSAVGFIDRAERVAVAALTSGEARAVEREFWTGEFGTEPHLAANLAAATGTDGCVTQTAATVVTGSPMTPVEGLALLEEALSSCYGNEGVIHITPATLTLLETNSTIQRDGTRLRSPNGHLVAAGAGYPGTGPDGTTPPAGVRWMYATGAVFARRSQVNVPQSRAQDVLDRNKNSVFLVAERTYVLGWECCHLAVPVRVATAG